MFLRVSKSASSNTKPSLRASTPMNKDVLKVLYYLRSEGTRHIITGGHAPVAERTIRTIKDLLYRRVDGKESDLDEPYKEGSKHLK